MSFLDELPKPFFILAPMDDVTDTVFRQIITETAKPDLFFTEFVNVDGLQSPGRAKLIKKLQLGKTDRPCIAQLWGLKPDNFYKTAGELAEMGFAGIDLNMGCPVKTVVKNGACAALINNRELAGEVIKATKAGAGTLPVCVKTRVGFTTTDMTWIEFLLSQKLDMLSIHGRTARQLSNVPADWALIGQVREMRDALCPATKIVGNGDVMNRAQGLELAKKYKLDGIMIGRGVFHDPFAFTEKSPWEQWTKQQKLELFVKHIKLWDKTWKNGEYKFEVLKKFAKIYIHEFDGASELRAEFMNTNKPQSAVRLLELAVG